MSRSCFHSQFFAVACPACAAILKACEHYSTQFAAFLRTCEDRHLFFVRQSVCKHLMTNCSGIFDVETEDASSSCGKRQSEKNQDYVGDLFVPKIGRDGEGSLL